MAMSPAIGGHFMLSLNPLSPKERTQLISDIEKRIEQEKSVGNPIRFLEEIIELLRGDTKVSEEFFNECANNGRWDVYYYFAAEKPFKLVCRELYAMDLHIAIFKHTNVDVKNDTRKFEYIKTLERVVQK